MAAEKGRRIGKMSSIKDGLDNKAFDCHEQDNASDFKQNHHQTNISLADEEEDTTILKTGNKLLRWNLAFNILLLTIIPLPLWLPFVSLELSVSLLPMIQIIFMASWLTVTLLSWRTYFKLWVAKEKCFPRNESLNHLIVLSTYKEPLSLLITTIESIEIQETAAANINLTISFEARTPDLDVKIRTLEERFTAKFRRLYLSVHPFGLAGEIPGKCSNANHGIRASLRQLARCGLDTDSLVITTCDADTRFHPEFFNALSEQFLAAKDPHLCLYQSPLLYNWRLDEASVVTRVTGIMRAALMMGALIPLNINTMSIFSFSGKLCKEGNYIHPGYQMDDIIALIRSQDTECCWRCGQRVLPYKIRP